MLRRLEFYCFMLLMAYVASCSHVFMALPYKEDVPGSKALPIDGIWEIEDGEPRTRFRIEKGRIYFYSNFAPYTSYGMVVAKEIQEIGLAKYSCKAAVYTSYWGVSFGPAEVEILSDSLLVLRYFPNPGAGLYDVRESRFNKVELDDEVLFLSQLRSDADNNDVVPSSAEPTHSSDSTTITEEKLVDSTALTAIETSRVKAEEENYQPTSTVKEKPGPMISLYDFGLYSARIDHDISAKRSSAGRTALVTDLRQITKTDTVTAGLGTRFGVEFVLEGEPAGERRRVEVRVVHPGITDPRIGKSSGVDQWVMFPRIGQAAYAGWEFSHEWELVPGEWGIEIWQDGQKELEKLFVVQSASEGTVYLIQTAAFRKEPNARNAMNALREKDFAACIIRLSDDDGTDWYTVFVGWARSREEAEKIKDEFSEKSKQDSIIHELREEVFLKLRGRCL